MTRAPVSDSSPVVSTQRLGPPWWAVLPVFALVAFLMTYRSLAQLDSHLVGNSGDSLLILWMLGWVQHAIPHGWDAVWNTSMYFPAKNTLAYSDSMISPAIAAWPLRLVFGATLSLNLLALATQTAALWFTYRLALLLTRSWPASVVAALMFAFSTPLLAQMGHYQLVLTAFLVPATLLALVHFLETWRLRYGVGLGCAFAALTTSATYYGLMMAVGVGLIVVGYLLWFRPRPVWAVLRGLLVAGAIAAVITLPVAVHYIKLQDDPYFRRGFDPSVAAHPSDFLSPDGANYVLAHVWPFDHYAQRGLENHVFPGIVATIFGAAGLVVLVVGVRRARGREPLRDLGAPAPVGDAWRRRVALLIAAAGAVSVVLALGDRITVGGHSVPMPFKVLRKAVPGFSGLRVTSRFVLLGECALALCGAFGVQALAKRLDRRVAAAVVVVLCGLVLTETARSIPLVRVPGRDVERAANDYLKGRPDGTVLELPIRGSIDGAAWAYTESPRLYVSLIDAKPRVNGYSGYVPPDFDALVPTFDEFPSVASLAQLDRDHVRYVVLRTHVVGEQLPGIAEQLRQDGVGRYTDATARARIAAIPPERVKRVTKVPGAYVVELRPARR